MRLRWFPVRWLIPTLLMGSAAIMAFIILDVEGKREIRALEKSAIDQARQEMHFFASNIEYALQRKDMDFVRDAVANLATGTNVATILVVEPSGIVLDATSLAMVGKRMNDADMQRWRPMFEQVRRKVQGEVRLSEDRERLLVSFPLLFREQHAGAIKSDRYGVLLGTYDLTLAKQQVLYALEFQVLNLFLVLLLLSLIVGLASYFGLTRRMGRIIQAARELASGNLQARAGLSSSDEIGMISKAFDAMAAEIEGKTREMRKLSEAINAMSEGVIITDVKGVIEYVNPAFSRITGYTLAEAVGKNPSILKSGKHPKEFYEAFWNQIKSGQPWQGRIIDRRKDGSLYTAGMSVVPLLDASGNISHFVSVQEDVTRQLELEEQFVQAQKMESIGTLVGGIAHDFNNMLAGMLGNLFLVKKRTEKMANVVQAIERTEALGYRASDMIKKLLAFARKDPVRFEPFDITTFIREAASLSRVGVPENVDFVMDFSDEELIVNGDATQIQQLLMNLISNARDAVSETAKPRISVAMQRYLPDASFRQQHDETAAAYALLMVSDNGCGIPEDIQTRIFEPFFTTKEVGAGSGLGLAMVYGAVQRHLGVLELESGLGRGSVFRLYFPLTELSVRGVPESHPGRPGRGERVLLADDEQAVREITSEVLTDTGYRVTASRDGQEALDLFRQHPEAFDLVLLDVVMPRLGGVEAARLMRAIRPDIPIIFVTGYDREQVLESATDMPLVEAISKPVHPELLQHHLAELLARAKGGENI